MNCNDLYACGVASYFTRGPYESLLSGEMNGTTCFTPVRGGREQCCWKWGRVLPELAPSDQWPKKPTPTMRNKSHSLRQPSPQVVLLLRALLPSVKADTWSRHSPVTTPRRRPLAEHSYGAAECQRPF